MSLLLVFNNKEDYILIPNEAIRVRVIANSNSEDDIIVKEEIKTYLNELLNNLLKNITDINDARKTIIDNNNFINNFVDKKLKELNCNSDFKVNYGMNYFPEKTYKVVVYQEGLMDLTIGVFYILHYVL